MATVKAVPDGYTTVTPLLNIRGAQAAITFYKRAFGAEERTRVEHPNGDILHAELKIGGSFILVSEAVINPPTLSSTFLYVEDVDTWWERATAAGAEVAMPLQDMFWGDRYGVLTDKWGNRWSLATHTEDVSESEMKRRAAEAMKEWPAP